MLHGRDAERAAIDRLLDTLHAGHSAALVVRGEAGIGKSALLQYAQSKAESTQTLCLTGVEAEAEIPFSSLELLVRPLLGHLDALPEVQAAAIRGVLGLAEPTGADRFLVGSAVLSLLASVAESGPVLCLIDDAHWLDTASRDALLFAARRLGAERVGMLLAVCDQRQFSVAALPELRLGRLSEGAARELLTEHASGLPVPERDRVVQEAAGNPLALVELSLAVLADPGCLQFLDSYPLPVSRRIQTLFSGQVRALPESTRWLLLISAAGTQHLPTVLAVVRQRDLGVEHLAPAESAGLVSAAHDRIEFRHPLIRSVVYQDAPLAERLAAHRALADAYGRDSGRRAWHLALSVVEVDETIAAQLEATAERARDSGGYGAVAAAYERAASLTPDDAGRARREALAARYTFQAGRRERAVQLAEQAAPRLSDPHLRADLVQLRTLALWNDDPRAALETMTAAAADLFDQKPAAAATVAFETLARTWLLHDPPTIKETADRLTAWSWPQIPEIRRYINAISGLAHIAIGEHGTGITDIRDYVDWILDPDITTPLIARVDDQLFATAAGDLHSAHRAAHATVDICRSGGAVDVLPQALAQLAAAQLIVGEHADARASAIEAIALADDLRQTGTSAHAKTVLAFLAAIAGDEAACGSALEPALAHGVLTTQATATCALSLLDLGLGRVDAALGRMEQLAIGPSRHARAVLHTLPNLVEAAAAAGRPERGTTACARYVDWAQATGRPWALSTALRCRAMLAPAADEAGKLYAEAVELGQPDGNPFEHARTELLYGTWLRRQRRVLDARVMLRSALASFEHVGATQWSARARAELRAAGEAPNPGRGTASKLLDTLTPQELQIVRLAARGMSNRKIAGQLFLSPRTVEYHLYKAYPKLDIASRYELTQLGLD